VKVREVVRMLKKDGWFPLKGGRTNHHHFEYPAKPGKVTVPGNPGDELPKGTLKSIKEQAGL
jgi:predicted RNA binding protein YcfA (HicA-like mRNA interferase family)